MSKHNVNKRNIMNEDKLLICAEKAIYESLIKVMTNDYNGPIKTLVNDVINRHSTKLESVIEGAYLRLIGSDKFKEEIDSALTAKLAKTIVSRMGGELESRVNELKANPETRAQITIAISKLVRDL